MAAGDVREGDVLSYDGGRGGPWTEASVVKVLTDNFPNLYFTIREAGMDGERRTVASCLRRNAEPPQLPPPLRRGRPGREIGRMTLDRLVKPSHPVRAVSRGRRFRPLSERGRSRVRQRRHLQCGLTSIVRCSVIFTRSLYHSNSSREGPGKRPLRHLQGRRVGWPLRRWRSFARSPNGRAPVPRARYGLRRDDPTLDSGIRRGAQVRPARVSRRDPRPVREALVVGLRLR